MLKQKTVYFREEDLPLWEAIGNKAEWLHNALAGSPHVQQLKAYVAPEEVSDYLDGLVLDNVSGYVYEEETKEQVEANATMVKELKKRGQVK